MFDFLIKFDKQLFLSIYNLPKPLWFKSFMQGITSLGNWGAIWILIGIIVEKGKAKKGFLRFIITLGLTFIVVFFLKKLTARERPFLGEWDSFPSGHAAISFAAAYVLTKRIYRLTFKISIWLLALLIVFSRIYLGKHYPIDIIAGSGIGLGVGWILIKLKIKSPKSKVSALN